MPITPANPFKGRQYPGDVILIAVRWYLWYPLAYDHVADLLAERGLAVDRSCVWALVQAYAPELNKKCRPYLNQRTTATVWTRLQDLPECPANAGRHRNDVYDSEG